MNGLKKIKLKFDNIVDFIGMIAIAVMTIIVSLQVFSRYFFSYTPRWSEEVSLLLLVWVSFIGIAVGFREKLHIGVGVFVGMLPKKYQTIFDYIAKVLLIGVAIIFIFYGLRFTSLMNNSIMAGTGLSQSVLYGAIPVSGFLMLIYGIELLFVKGMHQEWDDQEEGDEM
ncbi:TRAP transporter small permease [Pradoshia eiseniae]|uniref:TRAP transporter small permease n=1 Tax=Pradoshia eiseniae TaxID=2064768 RepID=A0A2S7N161_9BACI|nr:TRAP transporter small permease [Pradoshia eiseniae]PQD95737.1 TRAP transporter small permease [Pradoshia eiseniae]